MMTLKEFMETDAYKEAAEISIIGMDGQELDVDIEDLLCETVVGHHIGSGGYLEIELDIMKIVDDEKNEIIYDGRKYRKIIYPIYNEKEDITIIFQDTIQKDADATVISTEVVGFYYSSPDVEIMENYIGKLKAEFED